MHRSWSIMVALALVVFGTTTALPNVGDTARTIPTPYRCPQGLTFDGKYLWSVDRLSDQIYKIDPAGGRVVDSIPTPGYIPRGLAWDGQWLWCADAGETVIYAINPATRIVERTISCPVGDPTDLAWDGKQLWIAGNNDEHLSQISREDGTTITSIPAPTPNVWGLTFDGKYLWASDRFKDMIYMIQPETGDVVLGFETPGPHSCGLAWDGKHLWNCDYETDRIYALTVNDGDRYARSNVKTEQMEFTHQVRNYGPDTVKTLDVYLAIPHDRDNQELLAPVTFDPKPTDTLTDRWGQKVAHFRFTDLGPTKFTTVHMMTSAKLYQTRYFVFPDKVGGLDQIPKDIRDKYLIDDAKFALSSATVRNAVRAAVGDETNPYWIGRKIFKYVIEHVEYELSGGWNVAPAVLDRGTGSCSEYSFVYIAMCRAAGLPARYVGSIVVRNDDASYDDVHHRWVEIYLPNYGWLPVDPSGGDSRWPSDQAGAFGWLDNRFLITTEGGGGSEYLEWGYNSNERWTSMGRCKVVVESFGEWTPVK